MFQNSSTSVWILAPQKQDACENQGRRDLNRGVKVVSVFRSSASNIDCLITPDAPGCLKFFFQVAAYSANEGEYRSVLNELAVVICSKEYRPPPASTSPTSDSSLTNSGAELITRENEGEREIGTPARLRGVRRRRGDKKRQDLPPFPPCLLAPSSSLPCFLQQKRAQLSQFELGSPLCVYVCVCVRGQKCVSKSSLCVQ